MNEAFDNKHSYKDRNYDVVPYDLNWPRLFEIYASKIKAIFGGDVKIEHIGSTAVPGMAGKPCIDVLVIVEDVKEVEGHVSEMEQAGFEYAGAYVTEDSRLFRVMEGDELLANIHFFRKGHLHIDEMLNLRDYLRSHPQEVEDYSRIKKELYSKYADDYASYRKYKDEYMDGLMKRAVGA